MASIGRVLFHTFRAILGPPLFMSLPPFWLVPSASMNLINMWWCTTEWGQGRWRGTSAVYTLLFTINRPYSLSIAFVFDLNCKGWASKTSMLPCVFAPDVRQKSALHSPAVWFYLRCILKQHFNGLLTPDAHLSGVVLVSVHAVASNNPIKNHILITQLHPMGVLETHCNSVSPAWQWIKRKWENIRIIHLHYTAFMLGLVGF